MRLRRPVALAAALVLALGVPACSDDDDGAEPTSSSTTTTTTAVDGEPELLTVELEGRPSAVAASGSGDLWIASDGDDDGVGRVRRYAPDTDGAAAELVAGPAPIALVVVGDGVWVIGGTGVLTKLDPASPDRPAATVDVGGAPVDAVIVGGRLWVADIERSTVHVLDPENGEVVADPVPVPAGAVRLVTDGVRLWVSGLEDQVTPIDLDALVARQPVRVGQGPIGMAIVQDVLWIANSDDDTVSRISLESGQAIGEPLAVGDAPIALAQVGESVCVLHQDDASVLRLDVATGEPIGGPVALPMRPRAMAVSTFGLWVVGVDPSLAVLVP